MLNSKELYEKVEKLRIQKGLSVANLNRLAGISHATLYSWKTRGTMPKLEVLDGISLALETPISALLYDVEVDSLTGEEIELLSYWKRINCEQRKAVMSTIKAMSKT